MPPSPIRKLVPFAEKAKKRRLKAHPEKTPEELDDMQAAFEEKSKKRLREAHPDKTSEELNAMQAIAFEEKVKKRRRKAHPDKTSEELNAIPDDPETLAIYQKMKRVAHGNPEAAAVMTEGLTECLATMKRFVAAQKRRPKK